VALLVVLALGAGTVYAAIPNGSGTYYACLTKSSGDVRLINYPKQKCVKGERFIKWSQQGPAGPAGPAGAVGATGPAGPAGPAGATGLVTATVPCDGPIAAGGEYVIFDPMPRNQVHDFEVIPLLPWTDDLYVDQVEQRVNPDGSLRIYVRIDGFFGTGTQTCNVRRTTWTTGISPAKVKQQLKKVEVSYAKNHRR
jgi:hypothetical protein